MAITTHLFGRTGHNSTRVIFGGAALSDASQAEADDVFELITRYGVNHLDVAAGYGVAEDRVKPWLQRAPGQFFLATKTAERHKREAREQLERSLTRMGVDHVELWQLHNLADPIDWDIALSEGGAIEAAVEARQEGLVRWIGVTGHGTQVAATHRRSLARFDFDSVLLPYNFMVMQNGYYAENFEAVVSICAERRVAVQTIKSIAAGPWAGRPHTHHSWYMPLQDQADIDLSVWWSLARPGFFVNSVADISLLPKVLDAASRFSERCPTEDEMRALIQRRQVEHLFA